MMQASSAGNNLMFEEDDDFGLMGSGAAGHQLHGEEDDEEDLEELKWLINTYHLLLRLNLETKYSNQI